MAELTEYLNNDKSAYHAVEFCEKQLLNNGFAELKMNKKFNIASGGKYYVKPGLTSLFAFKMPEKKENIISNGECVAGFRIAMAHTDFPTFKLKPVADCSDKAGLSLINVEPYGGSLKKTWFDRPLGIAGAVYIQNDNNSPEAVLFDSEDAWVTIPSLAPHMDREIEKKDIDPAKEMNPVVSLSGDNNGIIKMIADKLKVNEGDILSYDLGLYDVTDVLYIGAKKEFIQSGKIDNMASCAALTEALINTESKKKISMIALFDNEEIGSRTMQGADSNMLKFVTDKILLDSEIANNESEIISVLSKSMLISADGAHGVHPNYPEKADTTSTALLGGGIVIKTSASQRYVTDAGAIAYVKNICRNNNISCQVQANKSGTPGGQTLGPIATSYIPVTAVDMGIPMLAMHSVREMICSKDYDEFEKLIGCLLGDN